jgi:hypothetical protein
VRLSNFLTFQLSHSLPPPIVDQGPRDPAGDAGVSGRLPGPDGDARADVAVAQDLERWCARAAASANVETASGSRLVHVPALIEEWSRPWVLRLRLSGAEDRGRAQEFNH